MERIEVWIFIEGPGAAWPFRSGIPGSPQGRFRVFGTSRKALQNTGLADFRQSPSLTLPIPTAIVWGSWRHILPCRSLGGVAQLGERLNGIQEVRGSIPLASITGQSVPPGCP